MRLIRARAAQFVVLLSAVGGGLQPPAALAFVVGQRWEFIASGFAGYAGQPITLTWSLVPDGTPIPNQQPSALISFLDGHFGVGPGGDDLTQRPWFTLIDAAFGRWSEVGGVRFEYESQDDGAEQYAAPGVRGVRGDLRLAAASLDGLGNTLASSRYPDAGDIVLDVDDAPRLTAPGGDYLRLRNTLAHEIGHGLGFEHVSSSDASLLMEPTLNISFDGPQLDEIRGLHYLYGDRFERAHDGHGNGSPDRAVFLGTLAPGAVVSLGADTGSTTIVSPLATDFLSISNRADVDYFSFEVTAPARLDVDVIPAGGRFRQSQLGESEVLIDAAASSDLSFSLFTEDGGQLAAIDDQGRGGAEKIEQFYLDAAGRYSIGVRGSREAPQLYRLNVRVDAVHAPEPASSTLAMAMLSATTAVRRSLFTSR